MVEETKVIHRNQKNIRRVMRSQKAEGDPSILEEKLLEPYRQQKKHKQASQSSEKLIID